ncbi:hypothetical protein CEXT_48121 [Caerostris extrusa]|uniref:Uncharacterized protein n=1 Tax=Caerostris extrusa TaxID=172846 RepID=A0AAV4WTM1_CAEEX|nr:hypothetical protein CEXT_48121 [Caerostris extrusa]
MALYGRGTTEYSCINFSLLWLKSSRITEYMKSELGDMHVAYRFEEVEAKSPLLICVVAITYRVHDKDMSSLSLIEVAVRASIKGRRGRPIWGEEGAITQGGATEREGVIRGNGRWASESGHGERSPGISCLIRSPLRLMKGMGTSGR